MQAYRDSTDICNTKQIGNDPVSYSFKALLPQDQASHSRLKVLDTVEIILLFTATLMAIMSPRVSSLN